MLGGRFLRPWHKEAQRRHQHIVLGPAGGVLLDCGRDVLRPIARRWLASLDHPNVVRCLACAEVEGELMMALELLPGRTLREVMREDGGLGWQRAVEIASAVARGLTAAHEHEPPVIHRDLKPENVMVLPDGSVKVTDFGIAKLLSALGTESTHSVGTLAYMSPEQIDAGPVDARSDLYALGVVLYELIAGRPPFSSSSPRELLNLACTSAPPPFCQTVRRGLPRGVERLVFELLEKAPDRRPGSAADVLAVLEPFAPSSGEEAPGPHSRSREQAATAQPSSAPVEAAAHEADPSPSEPLQREDTVALIERARLLKDIPVRTALLVIVGLSLLSGALTYAVGARSEEADGGRPRAASQGAP
jgi:serine/threonine-protein kinase